MLSLLLLHCLLVHCASYFRPVRSICWSPNGVDLNHRISNVNHYHIRVKSISNQRQHVPLFGDNSMDYFSVGDNLIMDNEDIDVFALATNNQLTRESIQRWEYGLDTTAASLRTCQDKNVLFAAYTTLLSKSSIMRLDPLQLSTFQVISGVVIDTLVKLELKHQASITELVDRITDIHLDYIEEFAEEIDDGGDEDYSQSANQEYLTYQFAGLVRLTYTRISRGLGADFDSSIETQELRTNSWVSTVYARLQRRFVRFLAGNVEETVEEQNIAAMDQLIDRIPLKVSPRYSLQEYKKIAKMESEEEGSGDENEETGTDFYYAPWELCNFILKIVRNVVADSNDRTRLEPKLVRHFQKVLSTKMRKASKLLSELAINEIIPWKTILPKNEKERIQFEESISIVEDMLNLGHSAVAAILTIWHVRHNIAGVYDAKTGEYVKGFIKPIIFTSFEKAIEGIPKTLIKDGVKTMVEEIFESSIVDSNKYSPLMKGASLLAHSIRSTASEELRAVVTYNSDSSNLLSNRDTVYTSVLGCLLVYAINAPILEEKEFLDNLIAIAVLEETIGVREPRNACMISYENALSSVAENLAIKIENAHEVYLDIDSLVQEMSNRVDFIQNALVAICRLPDDDIKVIRQRAFRKTIDSLMSSTTSTDNTNSDKNENVKEGSFVTGRKRIENVYKYIATMLNINHNNARAYIQPLGEARFDKSMGSIFMSADLVTDGDTKGFGDMYYQQMISLAEDLMIPIDQAQTRSVLLAGVVFESLIESALEEYRRMNIDNTYLVLKKAYHLDKHPLWDAFMEKKNNDNENDNEINICEVGTKMCVARLGLPLVQEIVRMIDVLRQEKDGSNRNEAGSGWGAISASSSSATGGKEYQEFLNMLRNKLMEQYSQANLRK
jgi:hypothetical protein